MLANSKVCIRTSVFFFSSTPHYFAGGVVIQVSSTFVLVISWFSVSVTP